MSPTNLVVLFVGFIRRVCNCFPRLYGIDPLHFPHVSLFQRVFRPNFL